MSFRVDNKIPFQYLVVTENLEVFDDDLDMIIVEERNDDIKKLERDLEELLDTHYVLANMVEEQGEELEVATNNIQVTEKDVVEVVQHLKTAEDMTNKKRRTGVFASIGGTSGAIAGGVGLFLASITTAGTILVVLGVSAGVGAITGAVISKVKPKKS